MKIDETTDYHVAVDGREVGTFQEAEIKRRIETGEIRSSAYVWCAGMADWQPIGQVFPSMARPPLPVSRVVANLGGQPPPLPNRGRSYPKWFLIVGAFALLKFVVSAVSNDGQAPNSASNYSDSDKKIKSVPAAHSRALSGVRYVGTNSSPTGVDIVLREVWDFQSNGRVEWSCTPVTHSGSGSLTVRVLGSYQVVDRWVQIHFDNGTDRELEVLSETEMQGSGDSSVYVRIQ